MQIKGGFMCPRCNGAVEMQKRYIADMTFYKVVCYKCMITTDLHYSPEKAVEEWKTEAGTYEPKRGKTDDGTKSRRNE